MTVSGKGGGDTKGKGNGESTGFYSSQQADEKWTLERLAEWQGEPQNWDQWSAPPHEPAGILPSKRFARVRNQNKFAVFVKGEDGGEAEDDMPDRVDLSSDEKSNGPLLNV